MRGYCENLNEPDFEKMKLTPSADYVESNKKK
jgi:hypothetical protein